jgi:tetratricopeptide (TPR) repeat protein
MTTDFQVRLQESLAATYAIDRELGGGGMSRVFVATEKALGRKVVIKVLPPELMEGVSVDRFKREIQVAAQLQHPHVLGVLSAGEANGMPYYTMPFVDGMSLRARLSRAGALPITEIIGVLRDVAKALAYAHEHGVVHRDIKPDNVLMSGGSAVVSDFGIAKAIAAARVGAPNQTLTSVGSAMGTPAYMAPEQAAADPAIDHRADIYAFGVMAYEMLVGKPPFHGLTPQRLLAAQMSETPTPVAAQRLDAPAELADLVMRCLEKDATNRPQNATDIVRVLESATSGGSHSAMPAILLAGRPRLGQALGLWAAASVGVAIVARAAIIAIGLPDWVFPGALIVMGLGLPAILFTYLVHRGAHQAMTMRPTTPGGTSAQLSTLSRIAVKASPHVTWRRTTLGGAIAIGALIVVVGGYMLLRALGIGPAGSLISRGAIRQNERLLVADFTTRGADSSLGPVVTEAFRAGLGQSSHISVMTATQVRDVLRRMQRPVTAQVDFALAREIATREGMKAVVDGSILAVGGSFTISARLVASQTGETLASFQESASDDHEILPAIDRLTGRMRERIGESLRDIREALELARVTTPSLDALRKYVQANRAMGEGDFNKGQALLDEAIALDTGFAMAYRKLAIELNNRRTQPVRVMQLLEKAYQHRDRLSDAERYLAEAAYFGAGPHQDLSRSISAYESLIDLQPDNGTALNNVTIPYQQTRDITKAQDAILRAEKLPTPPAVAFGNLGVIGTFRNDTAQVRRSVREMRARYPTNAFGATGVSRALYFLAGPDSAREFLLASRKQHASDATSLANYAEILADLAQMQGRANEAHRWLAEDGDLLKQVGSPGARLESGVNLAWLAVWVQGDAALAARVLDQTLAAEPVTSVPHAARPYRNLTALFALLGRVDRAKALVALLDRERQTVTRSFDEQIRHTMLGDIALAEKRYGDAQKEYREADQGACQVCPLPRLASAYDLGGNADSAIAIFTRYLDTPDPFRLRGAGGVDGDYLANSYRRLGELWEAKGDKQKALGYYLKFVDLWKNADPELQSKVTEVRRRIARLTDTEGK